MTFFSPHDCQLFAIVKNNMLQTLIRELDCFILTKILTIRIAENGVDISLLNSKLNMTLLLLIKCFLGLAYCCR